MSVNPVSSNTKPFRSAFTLVELLIVLAIFSVLAAIALPTIRGLLRDGKTAHQARQITTFLREARSRAIASKSEVGVLFERFGSANNFDRSFSIRMRLSNAVPPYAGEAPSAKAILFHNPPQAVGIPGPLDPGVPPIFDPEAQPVAINQTPRVDGPTNAAFFPATECPLLFLSAQGGGGPEQPIGVYDRLELQGGRSVVIIGMVAVPPSASPYGAGTKVIFDPRERLYDAGSALTSTSLPSVVFPSSVQIRRATAPVSRSSFKIHRKPNISEVGTVNFLKGMAIDLNFSGIGPGGFQLSQFAIAPTAGPSADFPCGNVGIVFAPDGTVSYMNYNVNTGSGAVPSVEHPASNIYLCLGKVDGVRPDSIYENTESPPSNIMNLDATWIVINPFTGRIEASPMASVDLSGVNQTDASDLHQALIQAREFAFQSDKLSKY